MSGQTDSSNEDPNQSIPSDPSPTPDPNDTEPQDDQASEKSLSSLEDYRSSSQETHIGVSTIEAITTINEQANGDNDGNSFDEIEDEDEDEDETENENQDGAGGEYNAHAGPSYWDLSALLWYDDSYDDHGSGNGTDHEGSQDQEDYQEEHQDESQEQEDNNDDREDEDEDEEDKDEEDEDEEDEEDEHETLIESTRPEVGSPERLAPGNPPPSPNQPPPSTVGQLLPPYDMDTRSYLRVPPYQSDTNARLPPPGYLPPPRHLPPELQGYELPPTHGLPRVQGLGQMGESLMNQPLYDNETYYGDEAFETFDEEEWPAQGSDALYDPYQDQGQSRIRRYSDGAPVFSPLPPPEIPLPPLPASESFLGHGPEQQYADQDQDQDQDQQQQQQQDQNQDQNQNPNGLPESDQFLNNLLQQPHGQQHNPEQNQQPDQSRRSASTEYDENGVLIGGGSGRQPYPDHVLPSVEGPNDQHGVAGTRGNPISLSSDDSGNPTNNGSRPETAITISTGSSASGCRPDASTISTGSSESGGAGPAPATGDGTSGQGHDGNQDNQAPPEGSATGQDQDEGSDPAPANDQDDREVASTGGDQGESGHVSPLAQVSPVYRTSSSGIDEATLTELAARGDHYFDSDSQEQQQQQQQEQSRPYDPTSPTYANYPYSPTQPMIPNTSQGSGQATEPNTQENYSHGPEDYYEQHVEEDPQQQSQHTPQEQALYDNLIDENRLDAPIALARDIVDVMREIIKSTSNSRHSSSRYSSPVITPTRERFEPAIPVPISFSTHYHRFFEPEPGSEVEQPAPTSYFPGPLRPYTYVPSAPESPGIGSGGEDEAEVGPPPVPVHTPVSVPSIIESGRFSTPEVDTESEPERLPSTPTPIPRPVLLRQLGIRGSPSARSPRSTTPTSERGVNIRPDEAAEEREAVPEPEQPADEDEDEPEPKIESGSDTEPTQNETPQANRDSESAQVKSESGSDIALETIPEYESAPESQPSTRAPSDAGSEYKPGPEQDTDSDSETELGNNQQLVADLEQDELGDAGREQAQEKEPDTNPESGKQSENDSKEAEYHSARESAPSPSPHPPPPPPRSPSPPPRRITRAYARQLQQGQQPATQTSTAAEQATEQGPSKTKKEKGKAKARESTPSPPPRGIKRKESSSPSPPPPSPPKRRNTRSQTLQHESNKADSGSGKGKGKGKTTTSKGTKRRAESPPETQEPATKKRKATEAETEGGSEQPTLKLRSNPKVATRADELRCTYHPVPKIQPLHHPNVVVSSLTNAHYAKVSPLIVNNPPTAKRSVYVFGANSHGQLGLGHAEANVTHPTLNTGLTKDTVGVVDIAAGGNHCVALTYDNRVLTWGDNSDGQLGRETQSGEEKTPMEVAFTAVGLPAETVFVQVAATESATFVLTEFGDVYGWGTFRVRTAPSIM